VKLSLKTDSCQAPHTQYIVSGRIKAVTFYRDNLQHRLCQKGVREISNNNKHLLLYTLKWMSLYVAIGFIAAVLLTFPASLIGAIGVFMLVNFLRTRLMLKKMGISMRGLFGSLRSSSDVSPSMYGYSPIKYYCMNCGNEHKEIACPKCGSKIKRVG
jgi:hypothetical protein